MTRYPSQVRIFSHSVSIHESFQLQRRFFSNYQSPQQMGIIFMPYQSLLKALEALLDSFSLQFGDRHN